MSKQGDEPAAVAREKRAFAFEFEKSEKGWRWLAYDPFGRVAGEGIAPTKAIAAACVIDTLART
jgi:hypothetical protein